MIVCLAFDYADSDASIKIVAAENFYGDVAGQIGGNNVAVTSILTNPDQDPHLFTVNVDTAKAVADAEIVIYSGIDYDPWMDQMNSAHVNAKRIAINVSNLIHAAAGDNPHIWYDPRTMPALAKKLAVIFSVRDPTHVAVYRVNLAKFLASMATLVEKVASLKTKFAGADVIATEPVFGYMAGALGFQMHALGFQTHVMNNVEPTAQETQEFETFLKTKKVKVLFYNRQASDPVASRMQTVAQASGVPVVGVTETEPTGMTYVSWMLYQLESVDKALSPR